MSTLYTAPSTSILGITSTFAQIASVTPAALASAPITPVAHQTRQFAMQRQNTSLVDPPRQERGAVTLLAERSNGILPKAFDSLLVKVPAVAAIVSGLTCTGCNKIAEEVDSGSTLGFTFLLMACALPSILIFLAFLTEKYTSAQKSKALVNSDNK